MRRALLVLAPATALAVSLYAVDLPLFAVGPGPIREVSPLIQITGTRTYPTTGRLVFPTVTVGRVNSYEAIAAWLDAAVDVLPERAILPPGQTDQQHAQLTLSQMDESKIAAVAVALSHLTNYPKEHGPGVLIQDVLEGAPAEGRLFPGDLIREVNGHPAVSVEQVAQEIRRAGNEQPVRFVVEVEGERRRVRVVPTILQGQEEPIVGVVLVANFPFDVTIESGAIGGPSAGLAWALGTYDLLTPGDLLDGRAFAATGAIGLDGRVLPIGGIEQKVLTAERAGAEVFLVPPENLQTARRAVDEIELVVVETFDQAIRYLEQAP
ncbi:MAG: YlbL family protein [Actinomycetota bacterium]